MKKILPLAVVLAIVGCNSSSGGNGDQATPPKESPSVPSETPEFVPHCSNDNLAIHNSHGATETFELLVNSCNGLQFIRTHEGRLTNARTAIGAAEYKVNGWGENYLDSFEASINGADYRRYQFRKTDDCYTPSAFEKAICRNNPEYQFVMDNFSVDAIEVMADEALLYADDFGDSH